MLSFYLNNNDITQMVSSGEWAGSVKEAGRTFDVKYINAPYDPNLKSLPDIALGDYITVIDDDDGELFFGRVTSREKSSSYGTLTACCIDDAQLLLKSEVSYSFTDKSPEEIAALVLSDLEFPYGDLASTGVTIESYIADKISPYELIREVYEKAGETTGLSYWIGMEDRALTVTAMGAAVTTFIVSEGVNITSSSFSESTDSVINRVLILDSEGNRIGQIDDEDSQALYGMYQAIYEEEDDVDAETAAKAMLSGPEQSLSVTVTQADNSCTAGKGIYLYDTATGQTGLYWIKNDQHTFEGGQHTMTLELSFQELKQGDD